MIKLHGKQAVQKAGCDDGIIRTAWLYSEFGKNFVKTMLNLAATKTLLKVVFDQTETHIYAGNLANVIVCVLKAPAQGVYHINSEGVCSLLKRLLSTRDRQLVIFCRAIAMNFLQK